MARSVDVRLANYQPRQRVSPGNLVVEITDNRPEEKVSQGPDWHLKKLQAGCSCQVPFLANYPYLKHRNTLELKSTSHVTSDASLNTLITRASNISLQGNLIQRSHHWFPLPCILISALLTSPLLLKVSWAWSPNAYCQHRGVHPGWLLVLQ